MSNFDKLPFSHYTHHIDYYSLFLVALCVGKKSSEKLIEIKIKLF